MTERGARPLCGRRLVWIGWLVLLTACGGAAAPPSENGADPEITRQFDAPERSIEFWIERFESESREIAAERLSILEALRIEPGSDVADVGAGTGLFEPLLAEAVGDEGTVYAVDISPRFLEYLRDRKEALGWTNVEVVESDEKSSRLAPDSVDLVFVCATYHHFTHVEETLASIRSALRPGGRLVIVDFRRVPGESSDWVMEHVRAGADAVRAEIEAAGFRHTRTLDILDENFFLEFELPAT